MGIAMGDNNGDLLGTDFFMAWFGFVAEKNTLLGYTGLKNPGKITWQRLPDLLGITIGETWIQLIQLKFQTRTAVCEKEVIPPKWPINRNSDDKPVDLWVSDFQTSPNASEY